MESQFERVPDLLKKIVGDFCLWANEKGKPVTVTRVADPVEGESGVHLAYRAVDIRDETSDGVNVFTDEETTEICELLNARYKRNDGKLTAVHHSFSGMPRHIHLQIAVHTRAYERAPK